MSYETRLIFRAIQVVSIARRAAMARTDQELYPRMREVNERIRELARLKPAGETWEFICECGATGCRELVVLTLEEYAARRNGGRKPIVAH